MRALYNCKAFAFLVADAAAIVKSINFKTKPEINTHHKHFIG